MKTLTHSLMYIYKKITMETAQVFGTAHVSKHLELEFAPEYRVPFF